MLLLFKIILVCALIFIIYNLFKALIIMNKNDPNQESMSKFIGRRVIVSVIVVIVLLVAIATGLITPNPHPY